MISDLNSYQELLNKLDYDIARFDKENNTYTFMDCLQSLNALPEWVIKSKSEGDTARVIAEAKQALMLDKTFIFDETKVGSDIDHALKLVRLVVNHAKHKTDKPEIPLIQAIQVGGFPYTLPIIFEVYIAIGSMKIDAKTIISQMREYWRKELGI